MTADTALERAAKWVFTVKELARMIPASETTIRTSLVDAADRPVKPSQVEDGLAWLHLYGQHVPVHFHGANRTVVFFRRDLEAAFGELHLAAGGGR